MKSARRSQTILSSPFRGRSTFKPAPVKEKSSIRQVPSAILPILIYRDPLYLGFLGARSIAAEDENTPEALQCRLYWDSARRQALRDYPWAFAQRRAWLARVALPSGFEQEYRFAYALPEACLKAHEVRHEGLLPRPFCLARDPAGDATILLTSASRALLLYTEDVRHCHQFDDLFAHMLARKLACLLAAPLLKSNSQKIAELEQLYSASLPQARQSDASERRPLPLPDSWLQAR